MKTLFTSIFLLFVLFFSLKVHSQWNIDPANPTLVSDVSCLQRNVTHLEDGNGGSFLFWLDSRSGCSSSNINDVYGQHYDADGTALWETNGREILHYATSVSFFAVTRNTNNGDLIIGSSTYQSGNPDSLRFRKIDDQGSPLWSQDLLALTSEGCSGTYIIYIDHLSLVFDGANYAAAATVTYCGGSNGNRMIHFNGNGILTGPYSGEPEGNQNYLGSPGLDRTYDNSGDTYLYYSNGNGAGAHASCMRVSASGDTLWGPIDVLAGTNGLNYRFRALSDATGIALMYESTGPNNNVDVFMRKLNADGTWAWNGNILPVCGADGGQGNFFLQQDNDFYYACWADGRPGVVGNSAIYAQKIDKVDGTFVWAIDGIPVLDQSSYLPYPRCVTTGDGRMLVTNESTNAAFGFNAMMVNADGSLAWTNPVSIGNTNYSPFYEDYDLFLAGENIITAWGRGIPVGGADGIYIAKIASTVTTTYIQVEASACDSYTYASQTFDEGGVYEVDLPGDSIAVLTLDLGHASDTTFLSGSYCYSYIFNENNYTESGIYYQALNNVQGCDSILRLDLEILNPNTDFNVVNDVTLVATEPGGNYQWIDCNSGASIGTGDQVEITYTGDFALSTLTPCEETSQCVHVEVFSVDNIETENFFSIAPNPGRNNFQLKSTKAFSNALLFIFDAEGNLLLSKSNVNGTSNQIDCSGLCNGVYFVRVIQNNHVQNIRWMKAD